MKNKIDLFVSFVLFAVFIYAGSVKALDSQQFFEDLKAFQFGSEKLLAFGALVLPFLEVYSAIALFIPKLRQGALALILLQLFIFEIWLGQAWYRGIIEDCPCFGTKGIDIRIEFGINLLLIAGCIFCLRKDKNSTLSPTVESVA